MIFVDTGGWFALTVPIDPDHQRAVDWIAKRSDPLVTTDYIIDETLTLLRSRGEQKRALTLGEDFFERSAAVIYKITEADVQAAWLIFREYKDKEWSFTDCTSKVIIENLKITSVLAFDKHFRQFGSIQNLP